LAAPNRNRHALRTRNKKSAQATNRVVLALLDREISL